MRERFQNIQVDFSPMRKVALKATAVVTVGYLLYGGFREGYQASAETSTAPLPPAGAEISDEVLAALSEGGQTNDILNPYTGVRYPLTEDPPKTGDWSCVDVPSGGTVYGAITVLDDPNEFFDISRVRVYIPGENSFAFNTENLPNEVRSVPSGTVVCGK